MLFPRLSLIWLNCLGFWVYQITDWTCVYNADITDIDFLPFIPDSNSPYWMLDFVSPPPFPVSPLSEILQLLLQIKVSFHVQAN